MVRWQVVEKDDYGTDWALVRDDKRNTADRFENQGDAVKAAMEYITSNNCLNALTKDEKLNSIEMFMMDDKGVYLGELDGEPWYLTYPKDIRGKSDSGEVVIKHAKGDVIQDKKFFLLEGRAEVSVRIIPGT